MSNLYITADKIGDTSGGGRVTQEECVALAMLGNCYIWGRNHLQCVGPEPWGWDVSAHRAVETAESYTLAHFYAGTFSKTVKRLKEKGCKVTYTCAAHDKEISQLEHEKLGFPFPYPHLTNPELWAKYLQGYKDADVLICPSQYSASCMKSYGCTGRIEIIPHGVDIPDKSIVPMPATFTVGYLGAIGPDKGLIYLLQAWKLLDYKDAKLLIAGRDSLSPYMENLVSLTGAKNVERVGWIPNVSSFYNQISMYVQPSCTEGFGIEVLEAVAHGRPVSCSTNAGACEAIPEIYRHRAMDVEHLASKIDLLRGILQNKSLEYCDLWRSLAISYKWEYIREKYITLWKELLNV